MINLKKNLSYVRSSQSMILLCVVLFEEGYS